MLAYYTIWVLFFTTYYLLVKIILSIVDFDMVNLFISNRPKKDTEVVNVTQGIDSAFSPLFRYVM